jgi:hypothetical protein
VFLALLAKQKEAILPFYLRCIEAFDYPKDRIRLYVRTNNSTDRTKDILEEWFTRVGGQYLGCQLDGRDVPIPVERYGVHEWNPERFRVLGEIRQESLRLCLEAGCDYYAVVDVDNFLRPCALKCLVEAGLPIVSPLLKHVDTGRKYSNYHHRTDLGGYYLDSPEYSWIWTRLVKGWIEVDVVHCTYLVRADVIPKLSYLPDGTGRHEYVLFSESARKAGIPQYFDNREVYGYLTLEEESAKAEQLMGGEIP